MSSADIPARTQASSTKREDIIPLGSFALNHNTAHLIVQYLIHPPRITSGVATYIVPGAPRALNKSDCEQLLRNYCQNNRNLLGPKFVKTPSDFSIAILNDLNQVVGEIIKVQVQQEQLGQAVVPTREKLQMWAQQKSALEALQKNTEIRTGQAAPYGDLKTQLERIQKFQYQLEQTSAAHLADFLTPEEQQTVLTAVSDKILKQIATQGTADQNSTTWTLKDLCDENPLVSAALSKQAIDTLSKQVASLKPTDVQTVIQAQTTLNEAAITIAPTRDELVSQIEQTFGISGKKAKEFVDRIEATADPNHTRGEMQALFVKNLSLGDRLALSRQGKTPEQAAQAYCDATTFYVKSLPLAQPNAQYAKPLPITKDAQYGAKFLALQGVKVDAVTIENALRGVSSGDIAKRIKLLEQQRLSYVKSNRKTVYIEAKIKQLNVLNEKFLILEKQFKLLPRNLQSRINWAKINPSMARWMKEVNPFNWEFYQFHAPTFAATVEARVTAIDGYIKHLEKTKGIGLFLNPGYHYALQIRRNQLFWAKLVRRNVSNRGLQRFIYFLPNRLLPSYWLRPVYWARRGSSKALMWAGKKLGKSALGFALRKAGVSLAQFTFKELFKKGLMALVGSAAAGPIGTAITIAYTALSWGFQAIKFAFSPQGQYLIKKVLNSAAKAIAGALIGLYYLIAKLPLMFMGGGLGFAIAGPLGF